MGFLERLKHRLLNPQNLGIWVLGAAVAGYMGPFGTFDLFAMPERVALWLCIVGWGLLLIAISMSWADAYLPDVSFRQEEIGRLVIMPPVIIAPLYPAVAAYLAPAPMPVSFLEAVMACYLLGGIVTCARFAISMGGGADAEAENGAGGTDRALPRLAKRLPDGVDGPILRISGKDHFVEIATPCGRHEVRMRLSDAVEEMDGVDGLFTHRSHWVARAAIRDVERAGGKLFVVSTDDARIPVSRGKVPVLEDRGLL
ncbi:MAG: LytTR family DNA-binding domain-containing protein [Pseudomonadota bacterium]